MKGSVTVRRSHGAYYQLICRLRYLLCLGRSPANMTLQNATGWQGKCSIKASEQQGRQSCVLLTQPSTVSLVKLAHRSLKRPEMLSFKLLVGQSSE